MSHGRALYPRKTDFRWLLVETLAREESADGDVELACCRAALHRSDTTLVCRWWCKMNLILPPRLPVFCKSPTSNPFALCRLLLESCEQANGWWVHMECRKQRGLIEWRVVTAMMLKAKPHKTPDASEFQLLQHNGENLVMKKKNPTEFRWLQMGGWCPEVFYGWRAHMECRKQRAFMEWGVVTAMMRKQKPHKPQT